MKDKSEPIDLDRCDPTFKNEVADRHGGEFIRVCYACGACSARCPVGELDGEFDPRRLIRLVLLGRRGAVLSSPMMWRCCTCYTCQETCPQNVNFTEIVFVLKNMAVEAGYGPPGLKAQVEILSENGRLYEITDFENKKREDMNLPRLEPKQEQYRKLLSRLKPGSGREER